MSLFRYRTAIALSREDDQCFSINNFYVASYDQGLDLDFGSDYYGDLEEYGEIDYELYKGCPICHVLSWYGPGTPDGDAAFDQLSDMAKRTRTPYRLSNIDINNRGGCSFEFDMAQPFGETDYGKTSVHHDFEANSDAYFVIILETRSDSFARTRYKIRRHRYHLPDNAGAFETIYEVTERASSYLRHLIFHFPDEGEAYCDVTEYRR